MRSKLLRNKWLSHGAVLIAGIAIGWLALPLWRDGLMTWHQQRYGLLVEQCDSAMRDHLQAKLQAANAPSRETGMALYAGEVGLIVCQDYDLYQKRLLQWGLSENELAQMRLKAIEARADDLDEVVATHEIRF
ncbi:TIGR03982 family His-Xaa-Ser system protein [Sphingomonas gilva]|uniref:TIGR03982 family His-Xaa-Ser system protein n=1 Tax=Sphingomonas gilva TaxID=2305907 RepID=UPI001CA405E4|nr:TIGR03982 family His-Xaa-Ser system protein [Sphingomonas gilva]